MDQAGSGVIHIGWDQINVYAKNGSVCIKHSPIEGREVVICVDMLFCNALIDAIKRAMDHEN